MPEGCSPGCGCANTFTSRDAEKDLQRLRRRGPDPTTAALIDALAEQGISGATLLDIGGGVGPIQLELLAAGAASTYAVDASAPYAAAARAEGERRGFAERMTVRVGDFVALAPEVPAADLVTLDRVLCCYSDADALLRAAADRARRAVGLVYPRVTWWTHVFAAVGDLLDRVMRRDLHWYLHPDPTVDAPLRAAGFERRAIRQTLIWQVVLYVRPGA